MVVTDEMNIFIPQSVQTQIELEEIADVKKQMIVAKSSRTVIGIIQDGLIGAYNITHDNMRIDWKNTMNILASTTFKNYNLITKDKEYTGKYIYSLIIPPNINIDRSDFSIVNSIIVKGQLNKNILSGGKNNMVQSILDEHGADSAKEFIDNTLRMINNFNLYNGFTVGIGDLNIPPNLYKEIQEMFAKVDISLEHKITYSENNPDYMNSVMFESQIFSELNIIRDNVSKIIMENFDESNKFKIMALSGSKGNATNIGQMAGCVGLQIIGGMVLKKKYNNRTLAYFHQHDDRPLSRGLIKNSLLLGESFSEFVFQMTAGREGIVDQVVRTSDIGYVQRKLIKMLEDVMIKYDGTVRSASNSLIQLVYGDSGADTTKQYEYKIKILDMNNTEFNNKYNSEQSFFDNLKFLRDSVRKYLMQATLDTKTFNTNFMFPVNLIRIVNNTRHIKQGTTKLTHDYVIDTLQNLLTNKNTPIIYIKQTEQNNKNSFKVKDDLQLKYLFQLALYDALAPKLVIDEYKLTKEMFDSIINKIKMAFNKNIVEPGEMVGIIAAQSLAEPLTQLNLNSIDWTEKILIHYKNTNYISISEIGKFIDTLIQENTDNVQYLGNNIANEMEDTYYLDINDKNIYITSVDENGKVMWKKIEAVTKHLPINKDGTNTLIHIKTKSGKEVIATKGKSFLTFNDPPSSRGEAHRSEASHDPSFRNGQYNKIIPIRGDELQIGTKLPVIKMYPTLSYNTEISLRSFKLNLDRSFGFFCGIYLAKGISYNNKIKLTINSTTYIKYLITFATNYNISYNIIKYGGQISGIILDNSDLDELLNNMYNYDIDKRTIPEMAYIASTEFITGLLDSYCSMYCYINDIQEQLELIIPHKDLAVGISTLLSRFGIDTIITYNHHLIIDTDNLKIFNDNIKLTDKYKKNILDRICSKLDVNTFTDIISDKIISITEVKPSKKYVYDLTIADTKNFCIFNNLAMRDSFHNVGIASMGNTTLGVPRMKELLSYSKNLKTPQMILYLNDEYKNNKDIAHNISSYIQYTTIGDIRNKIDIYYDISDSNDNNSITKKDYILAHKYDLSQYPWLIRIELNREKLFNKKVTVLEIKNKLIYWWDKRFLDTKNNKKEERKVINKISALIVLTNTDNNEQPVIHIRFNVKDVDKNKDIFNIDTLNDFIDHIIDKFKLKGLNEITKTEVVNERLISFNNEGLLEKKTHNVIYTSGINLIEIRYINGIDINNTISNDIAEIYNIFGIEIARTMLLREIINAFEKASVLYNYQNVSILVDLMTANGYIMSIDRHGINKSDTDPLSRASFEKTVEHLLTAAVYSETDNMVGISSRIMAGLAIKGGTGYCDISLDINTIQNSEYLEEYEQKQIFAVEGTPIINDIIKQDKEIDFIPFE